MTLPADQRTYLPDEDRIRTMQDGAALLTQFILQLCSEGISRGPQSVARDLRELASRLVDHKSGSLARRVRLLADSLDSGSEDWVPGLINELGLWHIYARRMSSGQDPEQLLPWMLWAGWSLRQEWLTREPVVRDEWMVMGTLRERREQLTTQRTWLYGLRSGRMAESIEYLVAYQKPAYRWIAGKCYTASVQFYPVPQAYRIRILDCEEAHFSKWPVTGSRIDTLTADLQQRLQQFPLPGPEPLWLAGVRLMRQEGRISLTDGRSVWTTIVLSAEYQWLALSLSANHDIALFGEWNDRQLIVLAAGLHGEFHRLY